MSDFNSKSSESISDCLEKYGILSSTKSAWRSEPGISREIFGAPPPARQQQSFGGGLMSGLMGTVAQGMAFGAGSEVAHQGVRSMMGGSSGHAPAPEAAASAPAPVADACAPSMQAFNNCIQANPNDIQACQFYMDALKMCKEGNF